MLMLFLRNKILTHAFSSLMTKIMVDITFDVLGKGFKGIVVPIGRPRKFSRINSIGYVVALCSFLISTLQLTTLCPKFLHDHQFTRNKVWYLEMSLLEDSKSLKLLCW